MSCKSHNTSASTNKDEEDSCNKNQSGNRKSQQTFAILGDLMVKGYMPKIRQTSTK